MTTLKRRKESELLGLKEATKYLVYRAPIISTMMRPRYPYKVDPGQLCTLIDLIDRTKEVGGSVVEIGVAQGYTSIFLMEHMRTAGDDRPLLLFDTFTGFTKDSIDHEVSERGKVRSPVYNLFRYGDEKFFRQNLAAAGYNNFKTHSGDASEFNWSSIAPISVVLLDIDVYKPTRKILSSIWPYITTPGGIVVDDCLANGPWDGSLQAYEEFLSDIAAPFRRVGGKGGLIEKLS